MQRLRVRFSRGAEVKFISHLDLMRLWIRALNRARIPLAYSEGFNPHPRISLAVPLALGVTSEAELMDVMLQKWMSPHFFKDAISRQMPEGVTIQQVNSVGLTLPALPAQVRFAEYRVEVETDKERRDIEQAVDSLLSLEHLPWQHQRDTGMHRYDLRLLIDDLWLIDCQPLACTLGMRLRCDSSGSGRPEQVTADLGFSQHPRLMHRTRLILETS